MNTEQLKAQEFILSLIHCMELGLSFEETFFSYLSGYQPEVYDWIYPLYLAEDNFYLSIEEGLKHINNPYAEHIFRQILLCETTFIDCIEILEDTLQDIEKI